MTTTELWHLKGNPYKVQSEARKRAQNKDAYAYFMEMGLGKSSVVLDEFIDSNIKGEVDGLVVICPNSLKLNWMNECDKWGVRAIKYSWPDVPDIKYMKHPFVLAINYEAVGVGRGEEFIEELGKRFKIYLCLDESICIKNPKSMRTKACLRLRKCAAKRRILSGAPITQGPHDLWAQLTFLDAIPKFKFHPFKYTFCRLGGFMGKQVVGFQNEEMLNGIIASHAFRARKIDWTDLPEKSYAERYIELTKLQKEYYMELEQDLCAYIKEADKEVSADIVLTKLIKHRQITSGFVIADDGTTVRLDGGTKKLGETVDLVEQAGKSVIFTVFNESMDMLLDELKAFNPARIRGKSHMSEEEVEEEKARFNTDPGCRAILCQIASGKYGHTLIGSEGAGFCHTSIYYENSYSLDERKQSEDRIHRHGQRFACQYVDFIACPLDRRIVQALQRKESIGKAVVDGIKEGL